MTPKDFNLILNPTEDDALDLVSSHPHSLSDINFTTYRDHPHPLNNYKVIKKAVEQDGTAIKHLFDDKKKALSDLDHNLDIKDICLTAVKNNGMAIEFIPDNLRDSVLCTEAVKTSNGAIKYLQKQQTFELCLLAAKGNGHTIQFAKNEFINKELCEIAVNTNGSAIKHVPTHLKTNELILTAIKKDPSVIDSISDQTEEMCLLAIETAQPYIDYRFLSNLRVQTPKVSELMVSIDGGLRYINNKTPELCWKSIKLFPKNLRFVPAEIQSPDMCLYAIKLDPDCYSYVLIAKNPNVESTISNLQRIIEVNKNKLEVKATISSLADSE